MMKTTGSVQEKNGRFYFVLNLYDAKGKRKIKWISTHLLVENIATFQPFSEYCLIHWDIGK